MLSAIDVDLTAFVVVELDANVAARARFVLERHLMRASDAIQIASCLCLRDETGSAVSLVAYDTRLADAARAEGLTIER